MAKKKDKKKSKKKDTDLVTMTKVFPEDAEAKARVKARKLLRDLGVLPEDGTAPKAKAVPDEPEAIEAWNLLFGRDGHYLTTSAEAKAAKAATEDAPDVRKLKEEGAKKSKKTKVEEVATDHGRVFEAGEAEEIVDPFAPPAEVVERDKFGRPYVYDPATGKKKARTRVTTYIDCLEDRGLLEKWKGRVTLEGFVVHDDNLAQGRDASHGAGVLLASTVRDLIHNRDAGLRKLLKKDKAGKLEPGELGPAKEAILKVFKDAMDSIVEESLEEGGAHEKAEIGTDLHRLAELYDLGRLEGLSREESLDRLQPYITASDRADLEAYADALEEYGVEIVATEKFVVDDVRGTAGTLDRIVRYLPDGATRRVLACGDLKTGRVDYGQGKIGMQVREYVESKGYDPKEPKAREDLKLSKKVGLLIHLPQGEAKCTIYELDLELAERGLKIAADVRAWRNEGKKVFDPKRPLPTVAERLAAKKAEVEK